MGVREQLPQRIREARNAAGLTQEQLAEAVDLQPLTISFIENGRRLPKMETLEAIAKRTNRPLSWFFPTADDDEESAVPVGWIIGHLESTQRHLERLEQEVRVQIIANRAALGRIYSETLRTPEERKQARSEARWATRRSQRYEAYRKGESPSQLAIGTEFGEQEWNRRVASEELEAEVSSWNDAASKILAEPVTGVAPEIVARNIGVFRDVLQEYHHHKLAHIQRAYPSESPSPNIEAERRLATVTWGVIFDQLQEMIKDPAAHGVQPLPSEDSPRQRQRKRHRGNRGGDRP